MLSHGRETGVELAILELLDERDRLAVDRIAVALNEPPDSVRTAVTLLENQRLVQWIGATDGVGPGWSLTEHGRDEVRRWHVTHDRQ